MALPGEINHDRCLEPTCGKKLYLKVCTSAAGYYLGTECDAHGPNSRESGYFASSEEADEALRQWMLGNKVGKRDTDFHPGEMQVIELGEDSTMEDVFKAFGICKGEEHTVVDDNPLTPEKVETVLADCFYMDGSDWADRTDMIIVQGVINSFAFDPAKVEAHAEQIHEMLMQLPDDFHETLEGGTPGGGTSFLNMCVRKDDVLWTGLHMVQEQLLVLGLASGWARYSLPRSMWPALHGQMPYVTVCGERQQVEHASPEEVKKVLAQLHDHPAGD